MARRKKKNSFEDLDKLLDRVKETMGQEFYGKLVESIDNKKWEYYHEGESSGYSQGLGTE